MKRFLLTLFLIVALTTNSFGALILSTKYPGRTVAPSADYPQGSAQNITSPGDGTGFPWDKDHINDRYGFFQRLLSEASVTPSGVADTVIASDYFDALDIIIESIVDGNTTVASKLAKSQNLNDLANKTTARTNLDVFQRSQNLADMPNDATARSNLDVYSKSEGDGRYLIESNNLSDLTNDATARSNLGVYSTTQADQNFDRDIGQLNYTSVATRTVTLGYQPATVIMWSMSTSGSCRPVATTITGTGFTFVSLNADYDYQYVALR